MLTELYSDDTESPVRTLKSYKAEESLFSTRPNETSLTADSTDIELSSPIKEENNFTEFLEEDLEQVVPPYQQQQQQTKKSCYSLVPSSENNDYAGAGTSLIFDENSSSTDKNNNVSDALLRFGLIMNTK